METHPSSTSRSSALFRTFAPVVCAALGLLAGGAYLRYVNPENQTRLRQIRVKKAALAHTAGKPRLIVCGDSSTTFGLNPAVLQEVTGLPTVNLGFTAGCGGLALMGVADDCASSGDLVVLSYSPNMVALPLRPEHEGRLLAVMLGDPKIGIGGVDAPLPEGALERLRTTFTCVSPGLRLLLNDFGRRSLRLPGFRYERCEIDDWGYFKGKILSPHLSGSGFFYVIADPWKPVLEQYSQRLRMRNVKLLFSFPWHESPPEKAETFRSQVRQFEAQMGRFMPVLSDRDYGIRTESDFFADTEVHLTEEGARQRSSQLGNLLNQWRQSRMPGGVFHP